MRFRNLPAAGELDWSSQGSRVPRRVARGIGSPLPHPAELVIVRIGHETSA
jgi:hypothetical protein